MPTSCMPKSKIPDLQRSEQSRKALGGGLLDRPGIPVVQFGIQQLDQSGIRQIMLFRRKHRNSPALFRRTQDRHQPRILLIMLCRDEISRRPDRQIIQELRLLRRQPDPRLPPRHIEQLSVKRQRQRPGPFRRFFRHNSGGGKLKFTAEFSDKNLLQLPHFRQQPIQLPEQYPG